MIWQEELKRDAVRIAIPEWDLRDDDIITFSAGWREAWDDGSCGDSDCCTGGGESEPEAFAVVVQVSTADHRHVHSYEYLNEHAGDFFTRLMRRASAANISVLDTMTRIAKREALHDAEVKRAVTDAEIRNAKGVYETAMRYASINDRTRAEVHQLAQTNNGYPSFH